MADGTCSLKQFEEHLKKTNDKVDKLASDMSQVSISMAQLVQQQRKLMEHFQNSAAHVTVPSSSRSTDTADVQGQVHSLQAQEQLFTAKYPLKNVHQSMPPVKVDKTIDDDQVSSELVLYSDLVLAGAMTRVTPYPITDDSYMCGKLPNKHAASVTKTDEYDDLNEEIRFETSLGGLISSFSFRISTACENDVVDFKQQDVTVRRFKQSVLGANDSTTLCAEGIRQNAYEVLFLSLPPPKPPDNSRFVLQLLNSHAIVTYDVIICLGLGEITAAWNMLQWLVPTNRLVILSLMPIHLVLKPTAATKSDIEAVVDAFFFLEKGGMSWIEFMNGYMKWRGRVSASLALGNLLKVFALSSEKAGFCVDLGFGCDEEAVHKLSYMNHTIWNCPLYLCLLVPEDADDMSLPFLELMSYFHCFLIECISWWWNYLQLQNNLKPWKPLNQQDQCREIDGGMGDIFMCHKNFAQGLGSVGIIHVSILNDNNSQIDDNVDYEILQLELEMARRQKLEVIFKKQKMNSGPQVFIDSGADFDFSEALEEAAKVELVNGKENISNLQGAYRYAVRRGINFIKDWYCLGTNNSIGQCESHLSFTSSRLYRVIHDIDEEYKRLSALLEFIDERIYITESCEDGSGSLRDQSTPIYVLKMSLDRLKDFVLLAFETAFLEFGFSLDEYFLRRFVNKIFMFSLPRPPEIEDLEDKVDFKGKEC